tara:strand:+ start:464192 stop:464725 length:534 start_codon:yes stop_codon:yes gene_type:complete
MLNRLLSILLLLCLIAPFLGSVLWVKHQKHLVKKSVKKEIIAGIDREDLVELTFSANQLKTDLNWKHSKEFEYLGKMYDIVEQSASGDSTTYWCWLDKEETELNNQLDRLLAIAWNKNDQQHNQQNHLTAFVKSLCLSSPFSFTCNALPSELNENIADHQFSYTSLFLSIESPPPQI